MNLKYIYIIQKWKKTGTHPHKHIQVREPVPKISLKIWQLANLIDFKNPDSPRDISLISMSKQYFNAQEALRI